MGVRNMTGDNSLGGGGGNIQQKVEQQTLET